MTAFPKLPRHIAAFFASASLLLSLAACSGGGDGAEPDEASKSASSGRPPIDETADAPNWANPVMTPGEKLTTIEAGDITVDVYQVDVVESPRQTSGSIRKRANASSTRVTRSSSSTS